MSTWNKLFIVGLLGSSALLPCLVFAQEFALPLPLSLSASPASPSPRQTTTITAGTPTLDTASTFFTWTIDGARRPELSGYGNHAITLTAGEVNSAIRVDVAVTGASGAEARASLTIRPSTLALSWRAQTYTPPWYKGKALPTPNSVVIVTASPRIILDGKMIHPDELVYHWSFEDQDNVLVGVGKRSFAVQTSDIPESSHQVRVVVEDMQKRAHKEGRLFITTTSPKAVIYGITPLGGIETRIAALFRPFFDHETLDFQVEPFFFPVSSRKELSYQWKIADLAPPGNVNNPFMLTIEAGDQNLTSIPISVEVSQPQQNPNLISQAFSALTLFLR